MVFFCGCGVKNGDTWWARGASEVCRHPVIFTSGLVVIAKGHIEAFDVEEKLSVVRGMMVVLSGFAPDRGERERDH